ncbi:glyoxylate/hydroxypyruvate reductase A-like [Haliotis cracherodii]|uniref:glyoxylate/hydroxypyruvate reductase A-like n=1 Tax=Haliotis cracherodii TaxID=6455 RepID=UPI0039EC8E01
MSVVFRAMIRNQKRPVVLTAFPTDHINTVLERQDPLLDFRRVILKAWWSSEYLQATDKADWKDVEIYFGPTCFVAQNLHLLPNLKWIQTAEAGVDTLLNIKRDLPSDVTVTRNAVTFKRSISQYVIGQIISANMNFQHFQRMQNQRTWDRVISSSGLNHLSSCSVGILGMGAIGGEVARACKYWDMTVWGLKRSKVTEEERSEFVDQYRQPCGLPVILSSCDFLVNILPSTPETQGLLNGDVLSHCSKQPLFINVGRGDVIDDDSLIAALRKGWLSGAVLDIFTEEPLPQNSPLWGEEGVVITPHASNQSDNMDSYKQLATMFLANYNRYVTGQALENIVDIDRGY